MSTSFWICVDDSVGGSIRIRQGSVIDSSTRTESGYVTGGTTPSYGEIRIDATPDTGYVFDYFAIYEDTFGMHQETSNPFRPDPDDWSGWSEYKVVAYFSEDSSSGGGGDSGSSGSGGSSANETWGIQYTYNISSPTSKSTYLDEYGIRKIIFKPSTAMRVKFTATSDYDLVLCSIVDSAMDLFDNAPPRFEDSAGDEIENIDTDSSGSETDDVSVSKGKTWYIAFWEYRGNECDVDWSIVRTDDWFSPREITTLSGTTSYTATSSIQARRAYYVKYTTPTYAGKLVCQTTSGDTSPNYYSHLTSNLVDEGTGRYRDEAIDSSSSYILDYDDNGRGVGRDTKIEYSCSPSTVYYWYVNAAYDYKADYSVPWSLNYYREYTLTYVSDGTTFSTQKFYENDANIILISSIPTKTGYSFVGWQLSTGTYEAGASAPSPGANATATAVWKKEELIIQYNANGGTGAPAAQTFTKTPITISATEPKRDGYQFKGWSTNSTATSPMYEANKSYSLALSGETINLYAVWQLQTYTVSYNLNGGTSNKEFSSHNFTIDNRSFTVSSYQPERTGYNFSGWSDRGADSTIITHSTNTTYTLSLKDYVLYAVWTPKTYTIFYNSNGGSGTIAAQTKTYGTNLILASSGFTNGNLRLSHWNTAADGSGNTYSLGASYGDAGTSNVTLYAIWADDSYSLIYDANGGVGGPGIDAKLPSQYWKINITTAPTRTNYTFKGWAETSTAKTPLYKTKTYPTTTIQVTNTNKILYAVWWPHFSWSDKTQISANLLVDYIKTYLNKTISKVTTSTSLLYLTSWYNEAATALGIATLPDNTIIQETHLQNLANAFNSY